jgi:hypothetical protein
MPRYFFQLSFGQRIVPDDEGVELPSRSAARDEALAVVRELANRGVDRNARRWASWFLQVADEQGPFFRTPISYPALEVVTPAHAPRAENPETAALREDAPGMARSAEIVRQLTKRRQWTVQLLKHHERLRRELLSLCLASEGIQMRVSRLISLARAAGGQD